MEELTICWSITTYCNLKCWYCFSSYDAKNEQYDMSSFLVEQTLTKLEHLSKTVSLRIVILGGEPSIYPNLTKIVDRLLKFARKVIIVTNGENEKLLNSLPEKVSIDLSYHGQDTDKFIAKINKLQEHHYVQILCVMDTKCMDRCIAIADYCRKNSIYCEGIPIVDNDTNEALMYSDDILNKFIGKPVYYWNDDLFGKKTNIDIYKMGRDKKIIDINKIRVCRQTNLALYADGTINPCCPTGQINHRKHIMDDEPFDYILPCMEAKCMMNRGCIDIAGWRNDPDGLFYRDNK